MERQKMKDINIWGRLSLDKKVSWIIIFAISAITFVAIWYGDIYLTYRHSLFLIDCLLDGNIFDYYSLVNEQVSVAVYLMPLYIVFAIWNIPTWIATRVFYIPEDAVGCLLWTKLIVVFFLIVAVFFIYHICKIMRYKEIEYILFFFLSSLFVYCPVIATGQYDIIEIVFMLWGLYFYLIDGELSTRAVLFFSIAISMKIFAFFVYLILILIEEKRVLHILWKILEGFGVSVITIIPFLSGYISTSSQFNSDMGSRLFTITLPGGNVPISIFWSGFIIICVVAYLSKVNDIRKKFVLWSWLGAIFWLIFFVFVQGAYPYWIIWMIPFLAFVIGGNLKLKKINILLETIMEIALITIMSYIYYWVYLQPGAFSKLIFKDVFINSGYEGIGLNAVLDKLGLGFSFSAIGAACLICGMIFLTINNPWKEILHEDVEDDVILAEKTMRILRSGLCILYFVVTLLFNIDLFK